MEIYVQSRARRNTRVLLTTFLLGLAIGISAGIPIGLSMSGSDKSEGQEVAMQPLPESDEAPAAGDVAPVAGESNVPARAGEETGADSAVEPGDVAPEPADAGEEPAAEQADGAGEGNPAAYEDVWPARHLFVSIKGTKLDDETKALLSELKPGGVVLLKDNIENRDQTLELVKQIKQAVGLGEGIADLPVVAVDQEGGNVNRLNLKDAPSASELGRKFDQNAARETGRGFGEACVARGIGVLFAPVLDVVMSGAPEMLIERSFGQDPAAVTALGLAFADGAMSAGVIPVVKHFPGHGAVEQDSHEALAVIKAKETAELAKVMFPFHEAVKRGAPGLMAGHIAVPALDQTNPMCPASLSPVLISRLVREHWNYSGVIVTDDLSMGALTKTQSVEQAAVQALAAGCDALVLADPNPERIRAVCAAIEDAVDAGALDAKVLSESKRRLEGWQAWLKKPATVAGLVPDMPAKATEAKTDAPPKVEKASSAPAKPVEDGEFIEHEIQKGESLSKIASKYGVSQKDIMGWNNMTDSTVKWGFKVKIRVPDDGAAAAEPPVEVKNADPAPADTVASEQPPEQPTATRDEPTDQDAPAAESGAPEEPVATVEPAPAPAEDAGAGPVAGSQDAPMIDESPAPADGTVAAEEPTVVEESGQAEQMDSSEPVDAQATPPTEGDTAAPATDRVESADTSEGVETQEYVVKVGDSVGRLAGQFQTTSKVILELNNISDPNHIRIGQKIRVPKLP